MGGHVRGACSWRLRERRGGYDDETRMSNVVIVGREEEGE